MHGKRAEEYLLAQSVPVILRLVLRSTFLPQTQESCTGSGGAT